MKIALCFSGQPRYIDKSFEQYQKGIFEKNDVDCIRSLWWMNPTRVKPLYGK